MKNQLHRVSLKENISRGHYSTSFIDVSNFEDFITRLKKENIYKVTFKYNSHFWEGENFHSDSISIEQITQSLFDWLIDKVEGSHRFIEVYKRKDETV